VHRLELGALGAFAGEKVPRIILVRPDRFVLAGFTATGDPIPVMDALLGAPGTAH
jgi:hypothetical protein